MKPQRILPLILLLGAFFLPRATAQDLPRTHFNIDWQLNIPVGTRFADNASGWGLGFEGGYRITRRLSLGGFLCYHTNFGSRPRQTLDLGGDTRLTTKQEHALYTLPFGMAARFTWRPEKRLRPYAALRLGTCYARMSSYYYIVRQDDSSWGFYTSPEAGFSFFPDDNYRLGFHMAAFFSMATNHAGVLVYSIDRICNFGFRFGIAF